MNFAEGFVLSVLLIDGGQAVLCAFGLFGGGNRGFSNPCPPLNRRTEVTKGTRKVPCFLWLRLRHCPAGAADAFLPLFGCGFRPRGNQRA